MKPDRSRTRRPRLEHTAEYGVGAVPCFDVALADDSSTTTPSRTGTVGDLRLVPGLDRPTPPAAQPDWAAGRA
ncbi:hypothetical protein AB0A71_21730 [Kitasatospora aureofaciens]|uniref:hypothetical protein n=1 Tax=Kitasatospora aureofaciens TaxID=1894 RepID=UPI0033D9830B